MPANVVYDSGWISPPAPGEEISLNHSLGRKPVGLSLEGRVDDGEGGYNNGLPEILDGEGDPVERIRLTQVTHENTVKVFCPAAYTTSGLDIRVQIFE